MLQTPENMNPEPVIGRWATSPETATGECSFILDRDDLQGELSEFTVVAPGATVARARELLLAGAGGVLIGDAALRDSAVIEQLAGEFGAWRIGVYLPATRMSVSWTLDTVSNADFRCLTPSIGAPAWEVLTSDGQRTGTEVGWWIEQMAKRGASIVVLAKDIEQDDDLNICAELVERFGRLIGLTPLHEPDVDMLPWLQFGKIGKIVIPATPHWNELAIATLEQQVHALIETVA